MSPVRQIKENFQNVSKNQKFIKHLFSSTALLPSLQKFDDLLAEGKHVMVTGAEFFSSLPFLGQSS